jgi:CPA2 family monovalent cation:H+ antiporter-2
MAISVSVAVPAVFLVLVVAVRYGKRLSIFLAHDPDEIIILTALGTVLLVACISERLQVSPAIGAFLVGIAVSGLMAEQTHRLLSPCATSSPLYFSSSLASRLTRPR